MLIANLANRYRQKVDRAGKDQFPFVEISNLALSHFEGSWRGLAPLHPTAASEAELLCVIFLRGLLLEEAGLAATGVLPAGITEAQLAGTSAPIGAGGD
jgi:hypothetical protein